MTSPLIIIQNVEQSDFKNAFVIAYIRKSSLLTQAGVLAEVLNFRIRKNRITTDILIHRNLVHTELKTPALSELS
jgi:hypothetical protein